MLRKRTFTIRLFSLIFALSMTLGLYTPSDAADTVSTIGAAKRCGGQLLLLKRKALENAPDLNEAAFDNVMEAVNALLPDDQIVTKEAPFMSIKDLGFCDQTFLPPFYTQIILNLADGATIDQLEAEAENCAGSMAQMLTQASYTGVNQKDKMRGAIGMLDTVGGAYAFLDDLTEGTAGEEWLNKKRAFFDAVIPDQVKRVHQAPDPLSVISNGHPESSCKKIGITFNDMRSRPSSLDPASMTSKQKAIACAQGLIYSNVMITDSYTNANHVPSDSNLGMVARVNKLTTAEVPFKRDIEGLFLCPAFGVSQAHIDVLTMRMTGHDLSLAQGVLDQCAIGILGAMDLVRDQQSDDAYYADVSKVASLVIERHREIYRIYTNFDEETEKESAVKNFDRLFKMGVRSDAPDQITRQIAACPFAGIDNKPYLGAIRTKIRNTQNPSPDQ